jgi:hypothetical protein
VGGGVQLGPLSTAATNMPIVPAPGEYDDGEIGVIVIGRGNRSTLRKPSLMPFRPPQTPHAGRTRSRAAAVGSQRLTAWAMARPLLVKVTFSKQRSLTLSRLFAYQIFAVRSSPLINLNALTRILATRVKSDSQRSNRYDHSVLLWSNNSNERRSISGVS